MLQRTLAQISCPLQGPAALQNKRSLLEWLGGRQYEVVVLDAEPKALRGGRYLSTLVCVL